MKRGVIIVIACISLVVAFTSYPYAKGLYLFVADDLEFRKDEKGYFMMVGESREELMSVNGESPEKYTISSLNGDGEPIYRIAVRDDSFREELEVEVTLQTQRVCSLTFPVLLRRIKDTP